MKHSYLALLVASICFCLAARSSFGEEPKTDKPQQFIYVLRLVPRLHSDSAWTKEDNMVISRHFTRFQHAIETGELILAGRTKEPGDKTFGIAIFEAKDEAAARAFMESDPAVVAGLMTAELHPFSVALKR
ncbi:MAG TPA: YciI family protein [Chthoniobacterales bacterium]|nr:YciI family protein [Chthoniobacterales bacterium]